MQWVLSFRDKPKLNSLACKLVPTTSTQLRALTRAGAIIEAEEDAADVDAQAFCATVASIRSKLGVAEETTVPFAGEVVVAVVVATARCTGVATITEFKPN
jgi:hypothetical protein